MPYLVRKIGNLENLFHIKETQDVEQVFADVINYEFKTTENTLSTWFINEADDIDMAVLAIASNYSTTEEMDFLYIDMSLLEEFSLEIINEPNETPYESYSKFHYDIVGLTLASIKSILEIYKHNKTIVVKRDGFELKALIKEAYKENKINIDKGKTKKVRANLRKIVGLKS